MIMSVQAITPDQFSCPLDFIREEHSRQFAISDWIINSTANYQLTPLIEASDALIAYLTKELPLHCADEEEDLLPALLQRCKPEDEIKSILEMLDKDHAVEVFFARHIVIDLKSITVKSSVPEDRFLANMRGFVDCQRRHLIWENNRILPLARARLSPEDLANIGNSMAARWRGIECS